jgi:hypothetical protein
MMEKSHFLGSKEQKKTGACSRFPLRYYKDNTSAGEMQIAFNFLLQFTPRILRFGQDWREGLRVRSGKGGLLSGFIGG